MPNLTPARDLDRPTAMIGMVETAANLAAPAIGGAVLVATSSTAVLLLDAAVLLLATIEGLAGGVRLVADRPPLRDSVLSVVVISVMNGAISVLVVPMPPTSSAPTRPAPACSSRAWVAVLCSARAWPRGAPRGRPR